MSTVLLSVRYDQKKSKQFPSRPALRKVLLIGAAVTFAGWNSDGAKAATTAASHSSVSPAKSKKKKTTAKKTTTAASSSATTPSTATAAPTGTAGTTQASATSEKTDTIQKTSAVTKSSKSEDVTVTGTRLSQTRLSNVMAGSTLDAKQLAARGYTNLGLALLRENPAFSVPSNSPVGSQGSWGAGQTFSGLLALGDQRTLTLIDGMRMVGGATASLYGAGSGSQVDVGTIPTSLVKKIDTRYGGAGAAYGADAVAGVVNYQLDDHFKGLDFNAQGNWTQKLDGGQEKVYLKYGTSFDHDKGGIVFDVEYRNADGLVYNDRAKSIGSEAQTYLWPALTSDSPYYYVLTRNERFSQLSATGIPLINGNLNPSSFGKASGGIAAAGGGVLQFSPNGQSLVPLTGTVTRSNYYTAGGNGLSFENYDQLYTPQNSLNLTTLGHYDFTPHLHATWQGWYQRGQAKSSVNQGLYYSATFEGSPLTRANFDADPQSYVNGNLVLSTANPYLTSAERSTIINSLKAAGQPTDTFYLSRANQDFGEGAFTTTNQMYRFQGGLNGDFDAIGRHFDWSVKSEYSEYLSNTKTLMVDTNNLINALDAVTLPDGSIGCAPGYTNSTAQTRSETCAPLNVFGRGQESQAALKYITSWVNPSNTNKQLDVQAEIHSTILKLPAGDVRWDLGYEHRWESYDFNAGSILNGEVLSDGSRRQYGDEIPTPNTSGAYGTHEVFGELDVPIVSPDMHVPGAYHISATANGRYINNSMTGSYWTYMFGGSWWPTRDFGFSGNYAQSVRNPSVTELFSPTSRVNSMASDPCAQEDIANGPNPAVRAANCAKQGIPKGFVSNIVNYGIYGTDGGNAHLQNEVSHSYTGTLHFMPHFIQGLQLDASFVDVTISNEIEDLGISDIMSACYDSASFPNKYCSMFSRDPDTHQVTDYREGFVNIANQHMQALEAKLNYYIPLSRFGERFVNWGAFNLGVNYNHYVKNTQTFLGATYPQVGSTSSPKDSFTANLDYVRGPLFVQWQTIYYGPSKFNVTASEYAETFNSRPDFFYFNTTIGYKITKNLNFNFMMNNVFNALPKGVGTVGLTRYYDVILGRSFQASIGVHF
ncbi:TonB-dependent receptor domain-containing protein [Acetobacter sp. KSO5]|uniref:TonB-dependent receptor domain-containing protein n=1 Tax=Acetobacter sp. KSO5 TaxID=3373674 RepID=UPI00376EBBEA